MGFRASVDALHSQALGHTPQIAGLRGVCVPVLLDTIQIAPSMPADMTLKPAKVGGIEFISVCTPLSFYSTQAKIASWTRLHYLLLFASSFASRSLFCTSSCAAR